jgi:Rod binding domain-containing protein
MQQSYQAGMPTVPAVRPGQSIESAAKGFEETFLAQLVKEMRQTLEPETLFGHDGGDVFGGMFDQFMAKHLTQAGGVGLAANLKHQLQQGTTHGDARPGRHAS